MTKLTKTNKLKKLKRLRKKMNLKMRLKLKMNHLMKHHQNYNSVLQMGEGYFKTRNFDESFNKTIVEHPMHRFNIEKGSLRDPSRTKRGGGKSSEAR